MTEKPAFVPFPKVGRVSKGCVITEKIDGTNACIYINGDVMLAGSRSRWLEPGKTTDNFGFASWVEANREDLRQLGDGTHFGEWHGQGIQRGYGLKEKRFALFNVDRWATPYEYPDTSSLFFPTKEEKSVRPACCDVVPILYQGPLLNEVQLEVLMNSVVGSRINSNAEPEGIVIYLYGPKAIMKKTFEGDEGKWQAAA